jgi:hypothetical protein
MLARLIDDSLVLLLYCLRTIGPIESDFEETNSPLCFGDVGRQGYKIIATHFSEITKSELFAINEKAHLQIRIRPEFREIQSGQATFSLNELTDTSETTRIRTGIRPSKR